MTAPASGHICGYCGHDEFDGATCLYCGHCRTCGDVREDYWSEALGVRGVGKCRCAEWEGVPV